MDLFVYVQLAAKGGVGRRVGCRTLSYGRRESGGASTLDSRRVKTMSDCVRGLVELSAGASNVLIGTPRDIPR